KPQKRIRRLLFLLMYPNSATTKDSKETRANIFTPRPALAGRGDGGEGVSRGTRLSPPHPHSLSPPSGGEGGNLVAASLPVSLGGADATPLASGKYLLLAFQHKDGFARILAVVVMRPFGLERVFVHEREGCIVHVRIFVGFEIRRLDELERHLVAGLGRSLHLWLIAEHAVMRQHQRVAVRMDDGDHFVLRARIDGLDDRAASGRHLVNDADFVLHVAVLA